jgi:di/tricarboxylate transporter
MPLAFGTILGGMTTMIGTPPNLIVSGFRAETGAGSFGMFDYTPVGLAVAVAGVAFVVLLGWRLVPARKQADGDGFETGAYLTEVRVAEKSKAAGMTLRDIEQVLEEAEAQVVGLVRNEVRLTAPQSGRQVLAGDILIIEAEVDTLASALSSLDLQLEEAAAVDAGDKRDADAAGKPAPDRDAATGPGAGPGVGPGYLTDIS